MSDATDEVTSPDGSGDSANSVPPVIGLLERLIRTHPIWFLPEVGRQGVVHLLQGKDVGCFIVRQSSKASTMAMSVRLPEGKGPHIEHYLIENSGGGKFHLEGSDNYFTAVPMLVAHYSQGSEELPVTLTLPRVLMDAGRQQLTSFSLLGPDFWQSSFIQSSKLSPKSSHHDKSLNGSSGKTPPPPIPPKQDVSDVTINSQSAATNGIKVNGSDPIVDPKKSSSVPIAVVTGTVNQQLSPPKPPPRTVLNAVPQPPVPPRGAKPPKVNPVPLHGGPSNFLVTTTVSVNVSANSMLTAGLNPVTSNAEVTLIDITSSSLNGLNPITSLNPVLQNEVRSTNGLPTNGLSSLSSQPTDLLQLSPNAAVAVSTLLDDRPAVPGHGDQSYFSSNASDKFSDYEDIWSGHSGAPRAKLTPQSANRAKPASKTVIQIKNGEEPRGRPRKRASVSSWTQTDSANSESRQTAPSPFYVDPVDAVRDNNLYSQPAKSQFGSSDQLTMGSRNSRTSKSAKSQSLESLLDHLRSLTNGDSDFCQHYLNAKNPEVYGDVSIQCGAAVGTLASNRSSRRGRDMSPSPSCTSASIRSRAGRESSWPVDSSWEWQSSDEEQEQFSEMGRDAIGLSDVEGRSFTMPTKQARRRAPQPPGHRGRGDSQENGTASAIPAKENDLVNHRRLSHNYVIDEDDSVAKDTVADIIARQAPELKVDRVKDDDPEKSVKPDPELGYDNLVQLRKRTEIAHHGHGSQTSDNDSCHDKKKDSAGTTTDTETVFSEPWLVKRP